MNMVLQARPPVIDADVVILASAQREDFADEVDDVAQSARIAERAEIAAAVTHELAREDDARERLAQRHLQIGILLVVLEPDVERRLVLLDEIALEQQRFALVAHDDRADLDRALDHGIGPYAVRPACLKI
ncbi:MAG: hypothetical protein JOY87_06365 [Candidatus Eremiobacteraeota bacterium]|nr:hypothetical protein [Candidatus Eremiobacteraeota bacterium]